ncbi:hypothetical protein [Nostoc sphaeroides]|uniref:Uncharacterized protein n=1 Tax=Nostoc sphaeroides CCNUC1 TaxID=2653204 RepID=A0A5P8WEZ7_9NOSO|nr:hypothetical protein [Nostoc sphaeroides]QFS51407.1 hypothetical protein GXM_08901 [Nostoc sphaeroides CCNUC1]
MSIEIHEFSTGIRVEETANGGWVSLGFTGQYMNCTLERIPEAVKRSIANREFAVTEGTSTEEPAIIGREVGTGEDAWSVMAVVTRGRDEKGRSVSVYRYFLCQEHKNLIRLIGYWKNQGRPTFKPSDHRSIGQFLPFNSSFNQLQILPEVEDVSLEASKPILLSPQQPCELEKINALAFKKFNTHKNGQPVSWAFNVEALEQPHRFQVIQPASDRAYQILQRAIAHVPQVSAPVVVDEEALKSALRSLMNSSQIKPEAVQVIAEALGNEQITSKYWHSLFDGQGAATAIKQKIYTSQMVRLVTLRAMVIPETLPTFLTWLNVKGGKNKLDENQTISLEFQTAIRTIGSGFPKNKLVEGLKLILPKLLDQSITPEATSWLFIINTIWDDYHKEFADDVKNDLRLIAQYVQSSRTKEEVSLDSFKCEFKIWQNLIDNWIYLQRNSDSYLQHYQPLAHFFETIKDYSISAYFYQVSYAMVPKNIFYKASSHLLWGLKISKQSTKYENFVYFINENFASVVILSILCLLLFSATGIVLLKDKILKISDTTKVRNTQHTSTTVQTPVKEAQSQRCEQKKTPNGTITNQNSEIDKQSLKSATDKFGETKAAINNIFKELNRNEKIGETLINILNIKEICYNTSKEIEIEMNIKDSENQQKEWIVAIYNYQKKSFKDSSRDKANGIITKSNSDKTYKSLKDEIKNKLKLK